MAIAEMFFLILGREHFVPCAADISLSSVGHKKIISLSFFSHSGTQWSMNWQRTKSWHGYTTAMDRNVQPTVNHILMALRNCLSCFVPGELLYATFISRSAGEGIREPCSRATLFPWSTFQYKCVHQAVDKTAFINTYSSGKNWDLNLILLWTGMCWSKTNIVISLYFRCVDLGFG